MAGRRRLRDRSTVGRVFSPWLVVSVGVLVMVVLLGVALGTAVGNRSSVEPGPLTQAGPLPVLSASSFAASRSAAPTASRSTRPTRSPSAESTRTVSPTPGRSQSPTAEPGPGLLLSPPPAQVTGVYRTVETLSGAFIGEVRLTNHSDASRSWTVRVELSGARLVSAWTDGTAPVRTSGFRSRFTFDSEVQLAAGSATTLRFHLSDTGTATAPSGCLVNGAACGR